MRRFRIRSAVRLTERRSVPLISVPLVARGPGLERFRVTSVCTVQSTTGELEPLAGILD